MERRERKEKRTKKVWNEGKNKRSVSFLIIDPIVEETLGMFQHSCDCCQIIYFQTIFFRSFFRLFIFKLFCQIIFLSDNWEMGQQPNLPAPSFGEETKEMML